MRGGYPVVASSDEDIEFSYQTTLSVLPPIARTSRSPSPSMSCASVLEVPMPPTSNGIRSQLRELGRYR